MKYQFPNGVLVIRTRPAKVSRDGKLATQGVSRNSGHAIWRKNNKGRGRIVAAGAGVLDTREYAEELYARILAYHGTDE